MSPDYAEKFWSRVDIRGEDECWPWLGSCSSTGYGNITHDKQQYASHRTAFFLTHGYWPNVCRHDCDNRPCCNPKHLLDGTQKDNVDDMAKRGRRGRPRPPVKISAREVAVIRMSNLPQTVLARRHGVSVSAISRIKSGEIRRAG